MVERNSKRLYKYLIGALGLLLLSLLIFLAIYNFAYRARELPELRTVDLSPQGYEKWAKKESPIFKALENYFLKDAKTGFGKTPVLLHSWPAADWQDVASESKYREIRELEELKQNWPEKFIMPEVLAHDQVLYLSYLARRGEKSAYFKQVKAFQKAFVITQRGEPNRVLKSLPEAGADLASEEALAWTSRLQYLRSLLDGYKRWPSRKLERLIKREAESIAPAVESFEVTELILADDISYPLVGAHEEVAENNPTELAVLPLAEIDLYVIRTMADWGFIEAEIADKYTAILLASGRGSGFYAAYYEPQSGSYVSSEENFIVEAGQSLKILQNLFAMGDDAALKDINEWNLRFYQNAFIASRYHQVTAAAMSSEFDYQALARLGEIALSRGQTKLHEEIAERLYFYTRGQKANPRSGKLWTDPSDKYFDLETALTALIAGY
ncbi:MAG: hypothetical protein Q4P08_03510 [Eubacteriales bacterium]|nr:hypothetical protein [Eubacteriales bacterium]